MNRIVYLHGFASSPHSSKARYFSGRFAELGVPFYVPDLAAGDFEHLTITGQLRVIERACQGETVTLMGSSLGGYLAALYAARHPDIHNLVLMAPAFVFGRRWVEVFGAEKINAWKRNGSVPMFHYGDMRERRLSYALIEDAEKYEDYPDFHQPALILHGTRDEVVPPSLSQTFVAQHANARLVLLHSGHELTDQLEAMWAATQDFLGVD